MSEGKRQIRFEADENTFIIAKFDSNIPHSGLCMDESQGGCSGIFKEHEDFKENEMLIIKVGQLDPIPAEVKWVKEIDKHVIKVGFHYLD